MSQHLLNPPEPYADQVTEVLSTEVLYLSVTMQEESYVNIYTGIITAAVEDAPQQSFDTATGGGSKGCMPVFHGPIFVFQYIHAHTFSLTNINLILYLGYLIQIRARK